MAAEQPGAEGTPELDEDGLFAHELLNTLFAIDMLLERALEHEELGTDPMDDVRRAREGVAETLAVVKRRIEAQPEA
jgi:hypothetical protein